MDEERKVLSLKEAYRFGKEHGLEAEIGVIRDMVIEWRLKYTSSLRRGYVVALFMTKGLMDLFNQQCWPAGKTTWGRRKCQFWLGLKARYEELLAGRAEDEEEAQSFAAEADLRDYLANNLERVEPGLRLFVQEERRGVEFPVEGEFIDILAIDKHGSPVVFELKLSRGRSRALGQLLYYMGWVDSHLGKGRCRGIVVAKDVTDDLAIATRRVQGVSLFRYKLSVSLEPVEQGPPCTT